MDTLSNSNDAAKFPLVPLLKLYCKHPTILYLSYYENFRLLVDWLGPIEIPDASNYPALPDKLSNWDCQELAKILGTKPTVIFHTLLTIHGYSYALK